MWLDDLVEQSHAQIGEREREALWMRGVTDLQIDQYRIGWLDSKLPTAAYPQDFLRWSYNGKKLDDVFMLPLTNALGELKGAQFRHVERERTGWRDYFINTDEPAFFGLAQAMPHIWETESVFVVEGGFDVFPIQRGIPQVFATITARVPDPLVRLLRRIARKVWLGYDMDETGRRGCTWFERQYGDEFETRIVEYPRVRLVDGKVSKDPSDLWEAWGDQKFGAFLRRELDPFSLEDIRYA